MPGVRKQPRISFTDDELEALTVMVSYIDEYQDPEFEARMKKAHRSAMQKIEKAQSKAANGS